MLYAITDERGNIHAIQENPASEEQVEGGLSSSIISQADADTFSTSEETVFYIDGQLVSLDDYTNPVPNRVTNYQIKQALNTNPADRQAVDSLVAASGDQNLVDGWNHASTFNRDHSLFIGAVSSLGWSQEKVDGYLKLANTYN